VGFPRDQSGLASYVYFDDETKTVYWRRVPFDVNGYHSALESMEPEIQGLEDDLLDLDGAIKEETSEATS
jgi:hypothetical protein